MSNCFLMRGVAGSGKSYLANLLEEKYQFESQVFSADVYWLRPDGRYDFNPRLLGNAHEWNFNCFCQALKDEISHVIVDNTNTTAKECSPYIHKALKAGYKVYIVEPNTPWCLNVDELVKRNQHSVPREAIERMLSRWEPSSVIQSQFAVDIPILLGEECLKLGDSGNFHDIVDVLLS